MTHAEIVKEFREIEGYLQSKAADIKAKYGDNPEFANEADEWHYRVLMGVCAMIEETECKSLSSTHISIGMQNSGFAFGNFGIMV